jgi:hypothetical protein
MPLLPRKPRATAHSHYDLFPKFQADARLLPTLTPERPPFLPGWGHVEPARRNLYALPSDS